jgi:type IV pilus biogenesis protein CpaD/CtpE
MTRTLKTRAARAALRTGLALAAVVALTGCEAQPVGTFDPARYVADPAGQAYYSVAFQPGSAELARGEALRLAQFLREQVVGPGSDVLLSVGPSGSQVLDAQRLSALRAAVGPTRAQVRVGTASAAAAPTVRPDLGLVRVAHGNRIVVKCPGNPADPDWELTTPLPELGCANAYNLALQAADRRDLFRPRTLAGPDGGVSAAAVQRYREGKVKTTDLDMNSSVGN